LIRRICSNENKEFTSLRVSLACSGVIKYVTKSSVNVNVDGKLLGDDGDVNGVGNL